MAEPRVAAAVEAALGRGFRGAEASRASNGGAPDADVHVWLRIGKAPADSDLRAIEATGAHLARVDGNVIGYRDLLVATVDHAALRRLRALPGIVQIDLAPGALALPLARSGSLVRLAEARGASLAQGELTGAGVRIVDLDSNANLFHPAFFRGDAGYFDWLDVDGDGRFDPAVDAVDLDRDGLASPGERLRAIENTTRDGRGNAFAGRPNRFDPGVDWVFVDTNGNGVRDTGPEGGFDDATPAFGEPLFTPDDVNQNGFLDVGERLVRLGTSKIAEAYVGVDWPGLPAFDHVFRRGVDLAQKRHDYAGNIFGYPETLHGTAVLAILGGDLPLVGRRHVGMAPNADLVLAFEVSAYASKAVPWALAQQPASVVHETARWTGDALDGSDPYSLLVAESAEADGVLHTCAVGNTGGSGKHAHATLGTNEPRVLRFSVTPSTFGYLNLTVNDRAQTSELGLVLPTGERVDFKAGPAVASKTLPNGNQLHYVRSLSPRGTAVVDVVLRLGKAAAIVGGEYDLTVRAGAPGGTFDAYVMDDVSGWGRGVAFLDSVASDDRTLGIPAVSDGCLAVGSVPAHVAGEGPVFATSGAEAAGERRAYSGQGPRIDGLSKLDLLAPDNPLVALPEADVFGRPLVLGQSGLFGGTSAAAPHVAGVGALLAERGITGGAAAAALRAGARPTPSSGALPNDAYGHGVLDAAGAFGLPVGEVGGPVAPRLTVVGPAGLVSANEPFVLSAVLLGGTDPAGAMVRWDDGYDGVWEGAYAPLGPHAVVVSTGGPHAFKARVRSAAGLVGEAVLRVVVRGPSSTPPASPPPTPTLPPTQGGGTGSEPGRGDGVARSALPVGRQGWTCAAGGSEGGTGERGAAAVIAGVLWMFRLRRHSRADGLRG